MNSAIQDSIIQPGWNAPFLGGLLSIILIDILLSGDNSIAIALAVQSLPAAKRKLGIFAGAGVAAVLRVVFTIIATHLMKVPYLRLVGGLLILWIAIKLLSDSEESDTKHKQGRTLFQVIWIIIIADLSMSLDNVLGVAGASKGSLLLLWLGLGLSIPLVIFASSVLSSLMEKFPIIVILGAAVLGKVGADLIIGDPVIFRHVASIPHIHWIGGVLGVGSILLAALWFRRKKTTPPRPSP